MLHNRELTFRARQLRKNMTKEERKLWFDFLKSYPVKFQAQKVIQNYIVDFYCASAKVIIEIDGNHHLESPKVEQSDIVRDNFLTRLGYKVIRFSNLEIIKNFNGVCDTIDCMVRSRN